MKLVECYAFRKRYFFFLNKLFIQLYINISKKVKYRWLIEYLYQSTQLSDLRAYQQ